MEILYISTILSIGVLSVFYSEKNVFKFENYWTDKMLRTKRDVDRHVEQLMAKIQSQTERNLKAFTIAKLYYNVGEFESARKYLVNYISVRENSATAFKLHGQVMEVLMQKDKALHSYKTSYELDRSQKDLILKICELITISDEDFDAGKAR